MMGIKYMSWGMLGALVLLLGTRPARADAFRETIRAAQGEVDATQAKLALLKAEQGKIKPLPENYAKKVTGKNIDFNKDDPGALKLWVCRKQENCSTEAVFKDEKAPGALLKSSELVSAIEGLAKLQKVLEGLKKEGEKESDTSTSQSADGEGSPEKEKVVSRARLANYCSLSDAMVEKNGTLTEEAKASCEETLDKDKKTLEERNESLKSLAEGTDAEKLDEAIKEQEKTLALREEKLTEAQRKAELASTPREALTFDDRMAGVREVRCYTAFCWGGYDGTAFAIEPVVELPVSKYWALGEGGLARNINNSGLELALHAGVRFWFAYDFLSVGVLLADPKLTRQEDFTIDASEATFSQKSVSRPWPTLIVGFFADVVSLTMSYDQLRNTDGSHAVDNRYRENEVLSRTLTFGLTINTFTAMRNAFGAAKAEKKESK